MLSFMHAPSSSPHAHDFLPTTPSPLSPRSANILGQWPPQNARMSQHNPDGIPRSHDHDASRPNDENANAIATASKAMPYSQRAVKRAPLQKPDDLKAKRRNNFLRKVQTNREDKQYEARGEDIMRMDYLRERRQYEAELAKSAPVEKEEEEEVEDALPTWSQGSVLMNAPLAESQTMPEEEVEQFVRDEDAELEALLEYMPSRDEESWDAEEEMRDAENWDGSSDLWSDDADYDALFSEVLGQQEGGIVQQQEQTNGDVEMDMS